MTAAQKKRMKAACDELNAVLEEVKAKAGAQRVVYLYLDGTQNLNLMNARKSDQGGPRTQDIVHSVRLRADGGDW